MKIFGQQISRSPVGFGQSIGVWFDCFGIGLHLAGLWLTPFLLLVTIGDCATAQEKPSRTLLQIGISHSEVLPPLPPNQQVGQVFDGFDIQPESNQETQQVIPRAKQPVQQPVLTTPARNISVRGPGAWQNIPQSAAAPSQGSTAKAVPSKLSPNSPKRPPQPSQAAITAALETSASYRRGSQMQSSPAQSAIFQSQLRTGVGTSINAQSSRMLNGSASAGHFSSVRHEISGTVKSPTERRFKIPAWMAGVWQRSDSNELSRVSLPSGKHLKPAGHNVASVRDTFGTYRDESGQIWQVFDPRQATGSIDRGADIDYHTVTAYDIIINGSDAPIVSVRATHVTVSKHTHRVVESYQDEELNTYSKTADGRLRTDSSVKVFDAQGKPQLLTTALSMEAPVAPFSGPVRKTTR